MEPIRAFAERVALFFAGAILPIISRHKVDMDFLVIILSIIVVGVLYIYINGKMYLPESFRTIGDYDPNVKDVSDDEGEDEGEDEAPANTDEAGYNVPPKGAESAAVQGITQRVTKRRSFEYPTEAVGATFDDANVMRPYMTNEDQYGDFEQDFIMMNEGGYNPSKDAINAARRRYPFDWSQLPPSANQYQMQQMLFAKEPVNQAAPYTAETFKDIEARDLLPGDGEAEAERERKLLSSYVPVTASEVAAPSIQSVEELVKKIYDPQGKIPIVKQRGDTNVYEIYEVKEKNPKIVYEDDAVRGVANPLEPLQPLSPDVPKYVEMPTDASLGLAPVSEKAKLARNSYATWDPTLEGIFGKNLTWQTWG